MHLLLSSVPQRLGHYPARDAIQQRTARRNLLALSATAITLAVRVLRVERLRPPAKCVLLTRRRSEAKTAVEWLPPNWAAIVHIDAFATVT